MLSKKHTLQRSVLNLVIIVAIFLFMFLLQSSGTISSYNSTVIVMIGINIILTVSLNMTTGILGQLTLGHAGFMSVGAYTAALFTKAMANLPLEASLPIGLLLGGLVAALFGIAIGIPALRLKGDYLAIITLAFGEIIRVIIVNLDFTGGALGLKGIPNLSTNSKFTFVYIAAILTIFVILMVIRSRQGRAIIAIREDEIGAEASGIQTTYYKIMAFTISAFFAGIAGGLYAHHIGVLDATKFGFSRSVEIVAMVVMGGMGSITGSVISATLLTILPEGLRLLKNVPFLSFLVEGTKDPRMLIYSALLVIIMLFLPSGLAGLWGSKEFSAYGILKKLFGRKKSAKKGVADDE